MPDNQREKLVGTASRYANAALTIHENPTVLWALYNLRIAQCTTATLNAMLPLLRELAENTGDGVRVSAKLMDTQRRGVPE